jgi:hypothetical protein
MPPVGGLTAAFIPAARARRRGWAGRTCRRPVDDAHRQEPGETVAPFRAGDGNTVVAQARAMASQLNITIACMVTASHPARAPAPRATAATPAAATLSRPLIRSGSGAARCAKRQRVDVADPTAMRSGTRGRNNKRGREHGPSFVASGSNSWSPWKGPPGGDCTDAGSWSVDALLGR